MIVISIEELETVDDYVYDLDTVDGTFWCGSKDDTSTHILCKNTDSCYVRFNVDQNNYIDENGVINETEMMKEHFRLALECSKRISKEYKSPINLEFEKVMCPFFLYAKKRYAYKAWTKPEKYDEINYKGIATVRRDFCPFVKNTCEEIFKILMNPVNGQDTNQLAKNYVKDVIYDLLIRKNIKVEDLIISKSLKSTYKIKGISVKWTNGLCSEHEEEKKPGAICKKCPMCNEDQTFGIMKFMKRVGDKPVVKKECQLCKESFCMIPGPHVYIANQQRKLDPINGPKPPDRINYVYVTTPGNQKKKQYEIVKDPAHAKQEEIDGMYYFIHQLQKPLDDIFKVIDSSEFYNDVLEKFYKIKHKSLTF